MLRWIKDEIKVRIGQKNHIRGRHLVHVVEVLLTPCHEVLMVAQGRRIEDRDLGIGAQDLKIENQGNEDQNHGRGNRF